MASASVISVFDFAFAVGNRERGAGHDDAGIGFKQAAAEKFRDVHGGGVQGEIALGFAGAFHPIHMVLRLLAEKFNHLTAQLAQTTIALDQFLPDLLVLAGFDQLAHRFAQALDGERHVVGHEFRAADAQFLPFAAAGGVAGFAAEARFGGGLNFFASGLDVIEKFVRLAQNVRHELHGLALAQRGQQTFFRARIPQPVQRVAHLTARYTQPDMARRDVFHGVSLVENHEVVLEENAAFQLLINPAEQSEKQGVIQDEDIRGENPVAHALEETDLVILREIGLMPARFGRTQAAFRADLRPDLGVRFDFKVRETAVLGCLGPFVNARQFLGLGGGEQIAALLHGLLEPAGAEIIRAAFQHGITEPDGLRQRAQHLGEHGQILFRELLLQVDGMRGNDGFFLLRHGEEDGGNEIGEGFAHAGAGFDGEVFAILQGARDGHGHLLLLRAELEVFRPG